MAYVHTGLVWCSSEADSSMAVFLSCSGSIASPVNTAGLVPRAVLALLTLLASCCSSIVDRHCWPHAVQALLTLLASGIVDTACL